MSDREPYPRRQRWRLYRQLRAKPTIVTHGDIPSAEIERLYQEALREIRARRQQAETEHGDAQ